MLDPDATVCIVTNAIEVLTKMSMWPEKQAFFLAWKVTVLLACGCSRNFKETQVLTTAHTLPSLHTSCCIQPKKQKSTHCSFQSKAFLLSALALTNRVNNEQAKQ